MLDVVLVVVVALGVAASLSTLIVHRVVLDESTYSAALAEADVYERLYTEVLPDPEMVAVQDALLGELRVPPPMATQARTLATNALRWTVPPATIRAGSETVVAGALAYVRGDSPRLEVDIDLVGVAERVEEAARTQVRSLLAGAPTASVATLAEYRTALADVVADLEDGILPEALPRLTDASVPDDAVVAAIVDAVGDRVDGRVEEVVAAAVAAGTELDGLIVAVSESVVDHADRATQRWNEDGPVVDLAARIEDRAETRAGAVLGSLDAARDVASIFRPVTALAAGVVALAAAWGLWRNHRDRPRVAALLWAAGLVAAGLLTLVLWSAIGDAIAEPLDRATGTGSEDWALPEGVRNVVVDVRTELGTTLTTAVVWRAGAALLAGAVLALVAVGLPRLVRRSAISRPVPALVLGGALAVVVGTTVAVGGPSAADEVRRCNGHVELCDRRYDQVVQAATHNSMSSPDVVQVWPEHDGDLRAQLDAGVRALLIDTHHWTAMVSPEQIRDVDPDVTPAMAETLFRLVEPFTDEREGTWLCHNHCAFGGMPFLDGMVMVREFLDDNPHDVVTLIIQDAITPDETAEVMREAGLEPFLHVHDPDGEWATYDELIDAGERLVVFAEQESPPPAWYQNAFEAMQETPFTVLSPDRFTCEPNRGDPDATLFLLNHWVQRIAPDRADSVVVNAHDVLVDRARRCAEERGVMPTYIAVNFYNVGDLMAAVDTLNGVSPGPSPSPDR